jgi:glycosyltransferase involved in cell wall biosynthesis
MTTMITITSLTSFTPSHVPAGRWLQVVSHLDPRYGGLSAAVPELSAAISKTGRDVSIAAFCAPEEQFRPLNLAPEALSYWPSSRKAWLDKRLRTVFEQRVRSADGLHLHGLWEQSTALSARLARRLGKPYVLSAHGMLEPWALAQKRLKKLLYAQLLERANVAGAGCLHALTLAEAAQYRAFGAHGPIAIIPNGVTIPQHVTANPLLERFPTLTGRRIVLYLGRLHQKKGLDLLLQAWAEIADSWPDAHLVLAGPDADGTRVQLETEITRMGLDQSVLFTGMLGAALKWSALAAAVGFVLPSHSEGLSVSVLEAMGMGVPVIVTEGCNMPEVAEHEAGWVVAASRHSLLTALQALLANNVAANQALGERGEALIRTRYAWPVIARQMADVYAWLEGSQRPQEVQIIEAGEPC